MATVCEVSFLLICKKLSCLPKPLLGDKGLEPKRKVAGHYERQERRQQDFPVGGKQENWNFF